MLAVATAWLWYLQTLSTTIRSTSCCGQDTGEGRTCIPANSPGKPAWRWCAVKAKLHVQLFWSVEILYGLYHNSLSEIASVAKNFCIGAGFGYSAMENRIFPSGLSVACFYAALQCGVNTGPVKILVLYVLHRLLWPPGLCPSVDCFPKLLWEDCCGGLEMLVTLFYMSSPELFGGQRVDNWSPKMVVAGEPQPPDPLVPC